MPLLHPAGATFILINVRSTVVGHLEGQRADAPLELELQTSQ
jgi:hypothetical protein